jgi:hypothetical protein
MLVVTRYKTQSFPVELQRSNQLSTLNSETHQYGNEHLRDPEQREGQGTRS